jgi:hypothetical protein
MDHSSDSTDLPIFYTEPFLQALIYPIMIWGLMVALATLSGQPGVVCITPMAWLLALWSGVRYVRLSGGQPTRFPLLGPVLLGAALGLAMGIIFSLVVYLKFPPASPGDVYKTAVLTLFSFIGGMVSCAGFCTLTAWLTRRQYTRVQ